MLVNEFMTKDVVTCNENQLVSDAASIMSQNGFSVMPIVDDAENLVGIVTESDFVGKDIEIPHALASLKRVLGETHYHRNIEEIYMRAKNRKLSEVMSKNPTVVNSEMSLNEVANIMAARNLKRIPVVANEKVVGIITRKDLIKAFNQL